VTAVVTRGVAPGASPASYPEGSTAAEGAALLPDPTVSSGGLDDAMTCIYEALARQQVLDLQSGQTQVAEDKTLQEAALAREQAALKRQEADEAGSGRGFFSSIGHLFTDVTGDLAHGDIARAAGDAEGDLRDAWNSPHLWGDIEKALNDVAGVAAGIAAAAQLVPVVGTAVGGAAAVVSLTAGGGAALVHVRVEDFAAGAVDAGGDATAAKDDVDSLQTATTWTVDDLKAADESDGRALDDLRGAIQTNDRTLVAAASITVRG